MRIPFLALALLAPAAQASDYCHDLWFTRNAIMDRAGYCFGSVLGQAVFDNAGCIGQQVDLTPAATARVAELKAREAENGCQVDTGQPVLDLDDLSIRRQLADLPIPDDLESACLGWRGGPVPLMSGASASSGPVGVIRPGDYVAFGHYPLAGWSYVTTSGPDWRVRSGGWTDQPMPESACSQWAG